MGARYLIDTNALLEFVAGLLPADAHTFLTRTIDDDFVVSVINRIEVLGHVSANQALTDFMDLATTLPLDDAVMSRTIALRKAHKIKLPDAIIAATALVHNLTLVSRNDKDFRLINGLSCLNPYSITK